MSFSKRILPLAWVLLALNGCAGSSGGPVADNLYSNTFFQPTFTLLSTPINGQYQPSPLGPFHPIQLRYAVAIPILEGDLLLGKRARVSGFALILSPSTIHCASDFRSSPITDGPIFAFELLALVPDAFTGKYDVTVNYLGEKTERQTEVAATTVAQINTVDLGLIKGSIKVVRDPNDPTTPLDPALSFQGNFEVRLCR